MSADKDFYQLVDDWVILYSPTKKILYDRELVKKEFGVYPQNVLTCRVVDGDKSDDIPGVKGIGVKTLIKEFPLLYLALQKLGCIPIASLVSHRYAEISQFVSLSGATACVVPDKAKDFDFIDMAKRIKSEKLNLSKRIIRSHVNSRDFNSRDLKSLKWT